MIGSKPKMLLLTHEFPYGNSETSFIGPEIKYLFQSFEIPLILTFPGGSEKQDLPLETAIQIIDENQKKHIHFKLKLLFFLTIFPHWVINLIFKCLLHKKGIGVLKTQIAQLIKYLHLMIVLDKSIKENQIEIVYSYWFDHWNVAACLYKKLVNPNIRVISRAHRYELVKETSALGFFPFHSIQFKYSDAVFFISSTLQKQYQKQYPSAAKYLLLSRLGVPIALNFTNETKTAEPYVFVSISDIKPIKNLELQAAAMLSSKLPIVWHHFGANKENNSIAKLLVNSNVTYLNHGFMQSALLFKFLEETPIHFLLNTSKSEGIPVSMMECIALGIPIIATNVGGVSELVNDKTGMLISATISEMDLCDILIDACRNYKFDKTERKQIQEFFKENYAAAKNYPHFCTLINQLT